MAGNVEEIHDLGERAFYMFFSTRSTIIIAIASSFTAILASFFFFNPVVTEKLIAGGYIPPAIE
jgi:hypothetical protein